MNKCTGEVNFRQRNSVFSQKGGEMRGEAEMD